MRVVLFMALILSVALIWNSGKVIHQSTKTKTSKKTIKMAPLKRAPAPKIEHKENEKKVKVMITDINSLNEFDSTKRVKEIHDAIEEANLEEKAHYKEKLIDYFENIQFSQNKMKRRIQIANTAELIVVYETHFPHSFQELRTNEMTKKIHKFTQNFFKEIL
jgi:hypothetical protein